MELVRTVAIVTPQVNRHLFSTFQKKSYNGAQEIWNSSKQRTLLSYSVKRWRIRDVVKLIKVKRTKALKAKKCCQLLDNAKGKERSSLPVSVKECTLTDP